MQNVIQKNKKLWENRTMKLIERWQKIVEKMVNPINLMLKIKNVFIFYFVQCKISTISILFFMINSQKIQ